MARGNPNPSPATRFTSSGNPKGLSKELCQIRAENAEMAYRIANAGLGAVVKLIEDAAATGDEATIAALVTQAGSINLMKEAVDRHEGKAAQTIKGDADAPLGVVFRTFFDAPPPGAKK